MKILKAEVSILCMIQLSVNLVTSRVGVESNQHVTLVRINVVHLYWNVHQSFTKMKNTPLPLI